MDKRKPLNKAPRKPMNFKKNPRQVALNILVEMEKMQSYAGLSLDKHLNQSGLMGPDRRLAAALVLDVTENRIKLDFAINHFMQKEQNDATVRSILRLGACQILLYDRVPDSAAVNECVNLVKMAGIVPLSGFVNGVLRTMSREKANIPWPKPEEGARYLSVEYSMPQWLVEQLIGDYGEAEARAILAHRMDKHPITLRPNLTRLDDVGFEKLLAKKVWNWEKCQTPHAYKVSGAIDISGDRDFTQGMYSIQGESSMRCAQLMDVKAGMQVLDCCAAPGGKSAYMAEVMGGTGRVHAWDVHDHRVDLIRAQARRLGLENLRPAVRDATQLKEDLVERMDAVLLDAPCTGLGVMLEKPDVKYRHQKEDLESLVKVQKQLLDTCCQYVKKGGAMVYSTCSILKDENEKQAAAFLERHPEFEKVEEHQLLSHRDGLDGFYMIKMIRR